MTNKFYRRRIREMFPIHKSLGRTKHSLKNWLRFYRKHDAVRAGYYVLLKSMMY